MYTSIHLDAFFVLYCVFYIICQLISFRAKSAVSISGTKDCFTVQNRTSLFIWIKGLPFVTIFASYWSQRGNSLQIPLPQQL